MGEINYKVHLKSLTDDAATVAGYGVIYGGKDLYGETFLKNTEFMLDLVPEKLVLYDHRMDAVKHVIGTVSNTAIKRDEFGIWIEAQLDRSKDYVNYILKLIDEGVLGWSSGSVPHLIEMSGSKITQWPIVEFSLTPEPAEPRTLGVEQIKSMFESAGLKLPEAFLQAGDAKKNAVDESGEIETEDKPILGDMEMDEKDIKAISDQAALAALKMFEQAQAEREALAAKEAEYKAKLREEVKAEVEAESAGKKEAWSARKGAASFRSGSTLSDGKDDHDGTKAYLHWLRTGDDRTAEMRGLEADGEEWGDGKKALQEGATTEGGYTVPDDFLNKIIEKRDYASWPRQAGVFILQTGLDNVKVPTETTQFTDFSVTAEEGTYTTNDPVFGEKGITVYKFTKNTRVSDELLADNQTDLEGYMARAIGRRWGLTEGHYAATGTGSSQPEGIFVGGDTDALTFDSSGDITADEIAELQMTLKAPYRDNAVWLMDPATEKFLRTIRDANHFAFPYSNMPLAVGDVSLKGYNLLLGSPLFTDDNIDVMAASTCIIMYGNPDHYCLVERSGLRIRRNEYLYMASGQVGFFCDFRMGGGVLQEEAWVGGAMSA